MKHTHAICMTAGPLTKNLIAFSIPIALTGMMQQLFNSADTAVVGHFTNGDALAAVGINGELIALFICLSTGLAIGSNVLIARCIGEKNTTAISASIHTSIALALLIGSLGMGIGLLIAEPLLRLIDTPETIFPLALLYLRLYFLGYPFLLLYDFASAILRSKGNSRSPFIALLLSGLVNVLLNLCLVIVFHMGVAGVAIATDMATAFSAALVMYYLTQETGPFCFSWSQLTLQKNLACSILKIGIPAALQGAVFCFANIFVQASVNHFGTTVVAGNTIAINFEYFVYYLIAAFGQTTTTFTSQNYGAGNISRCKQILKQCLLLSLISSACITIPAGLGYQYSAALFASDPDIIAAAGVRCLIIVLWEPICSFFEIPACSLRGLGYSTLPAIWTILGTCLLRILWILFIFQNNHPIQWLYIIFPISWILTALLMNGSLYQVYKKIETKKIFSQSPYV